MCRNRPKIEAFQRDLKVRIEKMEKQMRTRDICIIPEPYWDCASELMYYIDNSRADNLKEAINLHHIILHEMEISRTMDSMYRVALDTQRAAEREPVTRLSRDALPLSRRRARLAAQSGGAS